MKQSWLPLRWDLPGLRPTKIIPHTYPNSALRDRHTVPSAVSSPAEACRSFSANRNVGVVQQRVILSICWQSVLHSLRRSIHPFGLLPYSFGNHHWACLYLKTAPVSAGMCRSIFLEYWAQKISLISCWASRECHDDVLVVHMLQRPYMKDICFLLLWIKVTENGLWH